jgi:antitoxin component HigA of HigAB toxin-antitoxin module
LPLYEFTTQSETLYFENPDNMRSVMTEENYFAALEETERPVQIDIEKSIVAIKRLKVGMTWTHGLGVVKYIRE